ncbi:MAG: hypothetical protein WBP26_01990 [Candidatus Saccharimonadales bacterium]
MVNIEKIAAIANQTREEFEAGLITDEEIIAAAIANHQLRLLEAKPRKDEASVVVDGRVIALPINHVSTFPSLACDVASMVLKERISSSGALKNTEAYIISGSLGVSNENWGDDTSYFANPHSFVGIRASIHHDPSIIADITPDQFPEAAGISVYVGPVIKPWKLDDSNVAPW